ncbi:hypothetical protein JHK86_028614 [Glycine max]|nr:hypothetical protein JHK86_028614 [Glycine max]
MSPSPTKVTASPPTPFTKYIALRNGAPVGIAEDMMLRPDFDVEYFDGDVRSAVNF